MPLSRHIENIKAYVAQGNKQSAEKIAESLLRMYSRKSDQAKIKAALAG
jgi:hypothetical protein